MTKKLYKFYRIRHKPTGLFYVKFDSTSNLSKVGNLYKEDGKCRAWNNFMSGERIIRISKASNLYKDIMNGKYNFGELYDLEGNKNIVYFIKVNEDWEKVPIEFKL